MCGSEGYATHPSVRRLLLCGTLLVIDQSNMRYPRLYNIYISMVVFALQCPSSCHPLPARQRALALVPCKSLLGFNYNSSYAYTED